LVELRFAAETDRCILRDAPHSIRIVTDGEPGGGWGEFALERPAISDNEYRETALLAVRPETFARISKAKSVQVELGGIITFSLSPGNLSEAQALAGRMGEAGHQQ
jgi:hypothetical protein